MHDRSFLREARGRWLRLWFSRRAASLLFGKNVSRRDARHFFRSVDSFRRQCSGKTVVSDDDKLERRFPGADPTRRVGGVPDTNIADDQEHGFLALRCQLRRSANGPREQRNEVGTAARAGAKDVRLKGAYGLAALVALVLPEVHAPRNSASRASPATDAHR